MNKLFLLFVLIFFYEEASLYGQTGPVKLNLESSINLALRAQKPLGSALSAVDLSQANVNLAEGEFNIRIVPRGDAGYTGGGRAGDGITVGVGLDVLKKFQNGTIFTVTPSIMRVGKNYQTNLRLLLSQPLLRGFGKEYTLDGVYSARFANRNAIRNLYLAKIQLILQTIQSIYEITRQKYLVLLDEDSLERIKKFYAATKIKQKIGIGDTLDVYRAEIELRRAEDNLNHSKDRYQDACDNFRDLLGLPSDFAFEVDAPIDYTPIELPFPEAVEIAIQNRIEVDLAEDQAQESKRQVRIAKKNLKPELNLVLDYTSCGFDEVFTGSWTCRRENKWGFGFTTSSDFNNLALQTAYQQSKNASKDACLYIDQVKEMIALEVKKGLRFLQRAQQRITLQQEQINNSSKEFKFSNLKFDHGYVSNFDLIQAETNLRIAQGAMLGAIIDHKIGEYQFLAVLGTLADKPEVCP
jgi:outer membrane protein TolC